MKQNEAPGSRITSDQGSGGLARSARSRRLNRAEELKSQIRSELRREIARRFSAPELLDPSPDVRATLEELVRQQVTREFQLAISRGELTQEYKPDLLVAEFLDEILGLGPLQPLLEDPTIEEISINGPDLVLSDGELGKRKHPISFGGPDEVVALVNRGVAHLGRRLDTANPWVDGRLRNGARIHASTYPIAEPYPAVSIRLQRLVARSIADLCRLGTINSQLAVFLNILVRSRLAMLVAGGTRSGKTNFINVLAGLIDHDERLVVIEDTRELEIPLGDVTYLVTRLPGPEGQGEIDQQRLVANALRMGPDRVILAEARDRAAFDMLKATNTGHDGTMATIHADSAEEALDRLELLAYEAPGARNLPQRSLRQYIARAFQYVIFLQRVPGTTRRRVTQVMELTGSLDGDTICRQMIFEDRGGKKGLTWTGVRPFWEPRMKEQGFLFDEALEFRVRVFDEPED